VISVVAIQTINMEIGTMMEDFDRANDAEKRRMIECLSAQRCDESQKCCDCDDGSLEAFKHARKNFILKRIANKIGEKLREDKEKMKWISVKDRLPEERVCVLIFRNSFEEIGVLYDGIWHIPGKMKELDCGHCKNISCAKDVTHWFPLPERPN
jgi:Protein of unknown function (DUF551)